MSAPFCDRKFQCLFSCFISNFISRDTNVKGIQHKIIVFWWSSVSSFLFLGDLEELVFLVTHFFPVIKTNMFFGQFLKYVFLIAQFDRKIIPNDCTIIKYNCPVLSISSTTREASENILSF